MCDLHEPIESRRSISLARLDRRGLFRGAGVATVGLAGVGALGVGSAYAATSQNGWPAAENLERNRDFAAGGVTFPSGVALGAPNVILGFVAREFANTVEAPYNPGCWGFAYRPVTGGASLSNHASGTALDFNAPDHPLGASGTFTGAQVTAIRAILNYCEGTVRWGGDYSGRKDEMHFELNKPPGSECDRIATKINGGTPPAPTRPTISEGDRGSAVSDAQRLLNAKGNYGLAVDGIFGAATTAAAKKFQTANGLVADGVIGPKTWAKLDA